MPVAFGKLNCYPYFNSLILPHFVQFENICYNSTTMPARKIVSLLLILTLNLIPLAVAVQTTSADQLDDINKQLADLTDQLNQSVAATQPLQSQLDSEQKQIDSIK